MDRPRPGRRSDGVVNFVGFAAVAGQDAREAATRRRMMPLRLTSAERAMCSDELAEQFAVGRLDKAELDHRLDQLHSAVTHADLRPVFAGLPLPPLYRREPQRSRTWRWITFAGAVGLALPFVLLGLVFLVFGHEIAAAIFGLPAMMWVVATWRWAASGRRPG
jgi:hypothetical protein